MDSHRKYSYTLLGLVFGAVIGWFFSLILDNVSLSIIGAGIGLIFGSFLDEQKERALTITRCVFAIILTPILIVSFVWLEEIAKGTDIHYWGNLILNRFFVQIMFAAFIPLAIGTFLLLFCRIEDAPRKLKYVLYVITILALISTLFVAHSLATVPRGGKQNSFWFSPKTFTGNITRYRDEEYVGESYQTVFTQNYTASMVVTFGPWKLGKEGNVDVRLQTSKPVNLSGTLYLYLFLYRLTEDYRQGYPLYLTYPSEKPIDLEESSLWVGEIWSPEIRWGSDDEHERMRLEGYKIGFLLFMRLRGDEIDDVIPFTADVTGSFHIIDFRVDSSLQNGVAILLCGVFIGIYVQILGKPVIKRVRLPRRRRGLREEKGDIKRDDYG